MNLRDWLRWGMLALIMLGNSLTFTKSESLQYFGACVVTVAAFALAFT